jgi:hypothetical protein
VATAVVTDRYFGLAGSRPVGLRLKVRGKGDGRLMGCVAATPVSASRVGLPLPAWWCLLVPIVWVLVDDHGLDSVALVCPRRRSSSGATGRFPEERRSGKQQGQAATPRHSTPSQLPRPFTPNKPISAPLLQVNKPSVTRRDGGISTQVDSTDREFPSKVHSAIMKDFSTMSLFTSSAIHPEPEKHKGQYFSGKPFVAIWCASIRRPLFDGIRVRFAADAMIVSEDVPFFLLVSLSLVLCEGVFLVTRFFVLVAGEGRFCWMLNLGSV